MYLVQDREQWQHPYPISLKAENLLTILANITIFRKDSAPSSYCHSVVTGVLISS